MPLQKLELRPGVNREATSYANEGGFYACDKVRWRSGFAEKIGGWQGQNSGGSTFKGVCRGIWNWVTTLGQNLLGLGTNQKFYVELGGIYHDITPLGSVQNLGNDPFSTVNGSKIVSVAATNHGVTRNSFVTFSGATAVGGLTLNGEYEIQTVPNSNNFTIYAATAATSTATGGGASVVATFDLNADNALYSSGVGWGGPPWGAGGWGSVSGVGINMRLWSMFNYGDDLIFAERGGEIYYWTLDVASWSRGVTLESKANAAIKFATTATAGTGVTTITVPDISGINTGAIVTGVGIPAGAYVTTAWNGSTSVPISAATTSSLSSTPVTFSFAGQHIPNKVNVVIDSPTNDFVIACGSSPYDPTSFNTVFDPLLVRWADQGNAYEWVPEVTNQSGEQKLSHGSYIVTATNTRQEILVWTDTALFSMQYVGPPFVWSFQPLDHDVTIASQNCVLSVNNVVYWMGRDKFFVYSGRVETLPCTLRQYVFSDINSDQIGQVVAGANEGFNEVWWCYPSANSTTNDRYVVYNYLERTWYYGTLNRTAWSDHTQRTYPLAVYSVQTSYLSADINSTVSTISLTNATTYPNSGTVIIDSEQIGYTGKNGNTLTGCVRGVNSTTPASHTAYTPVPSSILNQVVIHEFGTDDQSTANPQPIVAYAESSDFDIQDGHNFGYVWRVLPDVNFIGSTATNPSVLLTVRPRQNSGTNYTAADTPTVTRSSTIPIEQYTGQVYTRIRGRQMAFRIESTTLGVAWQMGAMRIDVRPDGRR
jgi:hypothetical protein